MKNIYLQGALFFLEYDKIFRLFDLWNDVGLDLGFRAVKFFVPKV